MRQSNVDRDNWRVSCRERLSSHIRNTLGIMVKPSEVRLSPGPNDPYAWKILPEKHLAFSEIFSKNLSQHSINAYKALCEGVGISFEAVYASTNDTNKLNQLTPLQLDDISFSTKIEHLQSANIKLLEEMEAWKEKAVVESERAKLTDEQYRRLRESSEEQLRKICESNQHLQEQVENSAASTEYLKNTLLKCVQGLGTAVPMLEELRKGISFVVS
ncbi:hypothetical protein P152DRAFT_425990 [Eremomyces bilateralis CBS 781.70]|uniref:Uncharacterized protein n=1 Tax=Eremomyces bilateralis CBS 781.70 TaxID=1392243 RepID=A0A6G1FQ65_9PEZI|nr:uncharacterized protein P152DRAFT_425990 [Eremomyces bilateralis CBS 781.70]KAF1807831.1 hypothetical protein P152DRAFT_425990 [Eremomyces bilateralis CBS 781.70]